MVSKEATHINSQFGSAGPWEDWEREERYGRIRSLLSQGFSDRAVARSVGCANKTVERYREKHKIPNFYERNQI